MKLINQVVGPYLANLTLNYNLCFKAYFLKYYTVWMSGFRCSVRYGGLSRLLAGVSSLNLKVAEA
jgi:hypothetical protein